MVTAEGEQNELSYRSMMQPANPTVASWHSYDTISAAFLAIQRSLENADTMQLWRGFSGLISGHRYITSRSQQKGGCVSCCAQAQICTSVYDHHVLMATIWIQKG